MSCDFALSKKPALLPPLVQLLPLNMLRGTGVNRNKRGNTVDLLEHTNDQTALCNTFIFGVQNEVYLREQWGRERDGGLLAQQGKELLYFAPQVPSLPLICAVGQRTDPGKGQHLITSSHQAERLALKNKKYIYIYTLPWMHLHNSCPPPFPELHMCACLRGRSRVKGSRESDWVGWGDGGNAGAGKRGVDLRFCLSASHVENVWFSRWLTRLKRGRPKIYLSVLFSAGSGRKKADEACFFFLYLRDLVCVSCKSAGIRLSSQGDFLIN